MDKQYWIYTFGAGQKHEGKCVRIYADDYGDARQKMVDKYGSEWAFQYTEKEWDDWLKRKPFYIPAEEELEVIP